jgi:hypothetical protein
MDEMRALHNASPTLDGLGRVPLDLMPAACRGAGSPQGVAGGHLAGPRPAAWERRGGASR